ncbi:hypothetical protein [Cellvibrio fibrivorans]|uniref:Uncharacterized protein n=1 Tax=Cellvibrio fibrivorans TaxID=126350 RepID=A0ABU1UZ84_9GAMM|nr:hypothetical protein [Cellvibrio fibrivorans]MDR7090475.1 hypothetical protein [Cellvibrio fibrivorans]
MRSKGIHFSLALLVSMGAFSLSGCGGGDGDSARVAQTVDASKNGVTEIKITENLGYVHFKSFYQFELIGVDKDGKEINLTKKATWKITDSDVENIGKIKDGYFTAAGVKGNFTLVAEYAGLKATPKDITVSDANLTSVAIETTSNVVNECQNLTLVAKATFDETLVLPYAITWKVVSGANLGSFKDATKGILSTINSGTITLVATGIDNNNKEIPSPQFNVTVDDGLATIVVATTPAVTELRDGETATVKVSGIYTDPANPIDITDNSTITASPSDLLLIEGTKITARNGIANGKIVTLKGTCGGEEGTKNLTISERRLKSVEIENENGGTSNLSLSEGSKLNLNLTATYIDNSTKDDYTNNVVWKIDDRNNNITDDSKVTISSSGELSVNTDLNLTAAAIIYVIAEVRDGSGNVILNPSGERVEDEINITINPN